MSRLAAAALAEALDRQVKIAELELLLQDLEDEHGPVPPDEQAAAQAWADRELGPAASCADLVTRASMTIGSGASGTKLGI